MSKFAGLLADVSVPFKVEIIDPVTDEVIRDKSGKVAYITVWSADSERAREFDKAKRKDLRVRIMKSRTGKIEPDDQLEENMAKCAVLTESWHLVDRLTGEPIDVPCTPENAADLYSPPGMGWLFIQPWVGANDAANFLPKPPKRLSPMPSMRPGSEESAMTAQPKATT